jgi:membrane protein
LRISNVKARASKFQFAWHLLRDSFNDWQDNNALRLSAALAYYSIFSIAPLLVLSVGVAGLFWKTDAITGHLNEQLRDYVGPQASEAIETMVKSTSHPAQSLIATIVGIIALLFGASGVFGQLKDALNSIWQVKAKPGLGWWVLVRERLLSFGMVLVIGFLLLISFVLTALLAAFSKRLEAFLSMPNWVWGGAGLIVSFAVVAVLFAFMFKVLPDVTNQWRHVWVGAVATAFLFEIGKFGLAYYLGRESTASSFGAAGSVVLLLLWVYYASCILLFGAEFTKMYALASGDKLRPTAIAVPASPSAPLAPEPEPPGPRRESLPEIFANDEVEEPVSVEGEAGVLAYAREHMAAGLLGAMGCGLAVGLVSRAVPPPGSQDPKTQIRMSLHVLGAASLLLLTRAGRAAAGRLGKRLQKVPWPSFLRRP